MPNTTPPAGKLTNRLTLQSPRGPVDNRDAYGQPIDSWTTVAEVWANIEPRSGRELWHAQQIQADVSHRITLRYTPSLKIGPDWRGVMNGRIFDFLSVRNLEERNGTIEIMAVERV